MFELLELERPRNPAAVDDMLGGGSMAKSTPKLTRDKTRYDEDSQCVAMLAGSVIDEVWTVQLIRVRCENQITHETSPRCRVPM